jgi:hypothetical protein
MRTQSVLTCVFAILTATNAFAVGDENTCDPGPGAHYFWLVCESWISPISPASTKPLQSASRQIYREGFRFGQTGGTCARRKVLIVERGATFATLEFIEVDVYPGLRSGFWITESDRLDLTIFFHDDKNTPHEILPKRDEATRRIRELHLHWKKNGGLLSRVWITHARLPLGTHKTIWRMESLENELEFRVVADETEKQQAEREPCPST